MQESQPQHELTSIARWFTGHGEIASIQPLGNGNVNDTFLVEHGDGVPQRFVMQRINTSVFERPEEVMHNLVQVSQHVERKLSQEPTQPGERLWEMPRVIPLHFSEGHWVEAEGSFWRGISYIGAAISVDVVSSLKQAYEVGYGLGMFHQLIADLPSEQLRDTLEGFHITPSYLADYDAVAAQASVPLTTQESHCHQFIAERARWASVLEDAKQAGDLSLRPIHGDPKVNNLMMDAESGKAIALVDLDTVKPGLVHYDIGDCLRSGCNPLGEETREPEAVVFDLERCEAILSGYLETAGKTLSEADHRYLFDAIRLIPFELGLRFFTDHLKGNSYFKADRAGHNLDRALVQFALTASIEAQENEIRELLDQLR